jgi:DNA-binding response OmpR family regulator
MRLLANNSLDNEGVATMRAVIVDDDEGTRDLLRTVVEMENWECGDAPRFEHVQDQVHAADVVVLDVHLPGIGGLEAVRWMRDHGVGARVVLVTGDSDPAIGVRAAQLHVHRLLLKPFDVADLVGVLAGFGPSA